MIDLDVIDAKCNEYLNSIGRSCGTILDVNEIKVLVECARKAEKDAARYRWLRDCNWDLSVACVVADPMKSVKLGCDCPSGDRLDELVDAHL